MQIYEMDNQLCLFVPDSLCGKTSPEPSPAENQRARTFALSWRKLSELSAIPFMSLDLTPGAGNLLGEFYWELISPWRGASLTLNTGVSPRDAVVSSLSRILEAAPHPRYYLTKIACLGILRRASERGKELPPQLKMALMMQAGIASARNVLRSTISFAANQRDEVRDLHDVAGALGAQPGMKQQTFIASGVVSKGNGECFLTPDKHISLSRGGGQAGQGYPCVLEEKPEVTGCLTPWDTQQERLFTPESVAPTVVGADEGGGGNPAGPVFAAGFCAGASPTAGGIGYTEDGSPTLKAGESGTNMVPAVLCLNDQGGQRMDLTEGVSGTLRSQERGHQPLVMATQQGGAEICEGVCPTITSAAGTSGNNQPVLYENYGIDSRYTGPHAVAPTMSARYGTGGNNVPLIGQEEPETYCIVGNVIDRQPENGGNGKGYQADLAYTLTGMDRHAVYARQRVDQFKGDDVASCESARQHKDATDLVYQQQVFRQSQFGNYAEGCSTLRAQGGDIGGGSENLIVENVRLIRRLTPLECERLQGFPDGWTDIPGASDSARYKALGNSVAVPCVEYIMRGIALAMGAT